MCVWGGGGEHTSTQVKDKHTNTRYLYSLTVVDFDYVEVKTVNPFTWRDEITSLLIKILPNVYQDLKERK